jgi:hypothetical protein
MNYHLHTRRGRDKGLLGESREERTLLLQRYVHTALAMI